MICSVKSYYPVRTEWSNFMNEWIANPFRRKGFVFPYVVSARQVTMDR